jgi:hypothetical protein
MSVKELIEMLSAYDGDRIVVMAKDSEGNSYSPLSGAWAGKYRAETTWFGDVGMEELDDEDRDQGYTDEDVMEDGELALILTPVN